MPFPTAHRYGPVREVICSGPNSARSSDTGSAELPISAESQLIPMLGYANRFANHAAMIIPASASALAMPNMASSPPFSGLRYSRKASSRARNPVVFAFAYILWPSHPVCADARCSNCAGQQGEACASGYYWLRHES